MKNGKRQAGKRHGGLETVQETLARLGVADDADWTAMVLFARNLVPNMDLFSEEQKARLQAQVLDQMSRSPLDRKSFDHLIAHIQAFLLDNPKTADLRGQLQHERNEFAGLYRELTRVFADIKKSAADRQDNIQRLGADTEASFSAAECGGSHRDAALDKLRNMITTLVSQAREEARTWEERARALERAAHFDPMLSELYSRRALDEELAAAVRRCAGSTVPLSLLFLDVDRFKQVNDTYGHVVGDGVLRILAAVVAAHAAQFHSYPARFGGEELAVLCEGLDESAAAAKAESIRADVERCPLSSLDEKKDPATPPLRVTISIGVAQLAPGGGPEDLLLAADQAMYAAKIQGRNRVIARSSLAAA